MNFNISIYLLINFFNISFAIYNFINILKYFLT